MITGASISIENGFKIPPFKYNKTPNWVVSNNKNKNIISSDILIFFWKRYAPTLINAESIIIAMHSKNNKFISSMLFTKRIAESCPNIAIHLIFIKFVNKIVFTYYDL